MEGVCCGRAGAGCRWAGTALAARPSENARVHACSVAPWRRAAAVPAAAAARAVPALQPVQGRLLARRAVCSAQPILGPAKLIEPVAGGGRGGWRGAAVGSLRCDGAVLRSRAGGGGAAGRLLPQKAHSSARSRSCRRLRASSASRSSRSLKPPAAIGVVQGVVEGGGSMRARRRT